MVSQELAKLVGGYIKNIDIVVKGDEIYLTTTIKNNSSQLREYRVYVYSAGRLLGKEPDFYWKNVSGGQTTNILVKTAWNPFVDISDVGQSIDVELKEQHLGLVDSKRVNFGEISGATIDNGSSIKVRDRKTTLTLGGVTSTEEPFVNFIDLYRGDKGTNWTSLLLIGIVGLIIFAFIWKRKK